MTAHLTEQQILSFLHGEGHDTTAEPVKQHVAQCAACADMLAKEASLEQSLWEVRQHARACPGCGRMAAVQQGPLRCNHCGVALEPGGFRVLDVLVSTDRGRLYLAESPEGTKVALKELVFAHVPDQAQVASFEREGRLLRQLDHPQIPAFVASFEQGEGVGKRLYLAQEYVEGPSLLTRLAEHRFTEQEAADIAKQVLDIVVYLQDLSPPVFHRDIKPANIICRADGSICLVDFGAARDRGASSGATTAVGTFGYMPTEQLTGIVDATTDLHALGATLLHILTRRAPWEVTDPAAVLQKATMSDGFRRFVETLVAPRMADRFAGARAARGALGQAQRPPASRRRWLWGVSATAVVVGVTTMGVAFFQHFGSKDPTNTLPLVSWLPSPGSVLLQRPMNALDETFVVFAVLGGALLLIRVLLQTVGADAHDGDLHAGMDVGHGDVDHGDLDAGTKLLTFQGGAAFLLMFGLVGLALSRQSGLGGLIALLGGASAGLASMWGIAKLFQAAVKLESSGTIDTKNAIGQEGTVYLTIPAGGSGKVQVPVQDRLMEFEAVSNDPSPIATGERIRVVLVRDGNVMVVERVGEMANVLTTRPPQNE